WTSPLTSVSSFHFRVSSQNRTPGLPPIPPKTPSRSTREDGRNVRAAPAVTAVSYCRLRGPRRSRGKKSTSGNPEPLSKAHGLAVVSAVAGAQALARLRIDHDALRVAPLAAPFDFMPHGLQQLHRIRREADALHADRIRHPLVMKPRRVHSLLDV